MEKTIAAISTAMGAGGIGIIRMSGKETFSVIKKIFYPAKGNLKTEEIKGYSILYGNIIDPKTKEVVDEVLVSFFKTPKSYTTEDMCEINSHGGIAVEKKILDLCLENGAELAEAGEFTKRAFLNGRIDLSQAEAVIDLIEAKTQKEAGASIKQLKGLESRKIEEIEKDLLNIMADIEASIDYPEYDIEEVTSKRVKKELTEVKEKLKKLEEGFDTGKILKEGIKTVILGKPNAGKSSILNLLLKEERAIVSDIAGTTRDTIEEFINIEGVPLTIIDTAGIRQAKDQIEKIGVQKSLKLLEEADLILAVFDNTKNLEEEDLLILEKIEDKNAICLINKVDESKENLEKNKHIKRIKKPTVLISAKTGEGIENLYKEIIKMFELEQIKNDDSIFITNQRHQLQIKKALESLDNAADTIEKNMPIDICAIYIKNILEELGKITGKDVSEDIIKEIFSKFCLGK